MSRMYVMVGSIVLLAVGTVAAVSGTESRDRLSKLPRAVRATIEKHVAGGKILEIEVEEEHGRRVYSVEATREGERIEFLVATDGKYLGAEQDEDEAEAAEENEGAEENEVGEDEDADEEGEEHEASIPLARVPAPARRAIAAAVGDHRIAKVVREGDEDGILYEAEYVEVRRAECSVKVSASGEIVEREREIPARDLPQAVRRALHREFPGSRIAEASAVELHYYEVEIAGDHGRREVVVLATGAIQDDEADEDEAGEEGEEDDD